MKFDLSSFILGGFSMGLIYIGVSVAADFIDKKLDKKHTGGSFFELYEDNEDFDLDDDTETFFTSCRFDESYKENKDCCGVRDHSAEN